ncbi:primosomal protein [Kineococcus terrestris]|uniref:primosomal protein n=1 Tax=Kineococcus terrestris TaxID=2044856 RepID=UPI0034DB214E
MTTDPRAALARLVSALERHLEVASSRRSEADPAVAGAYQQLAEAFEVYDDALYSAYDEVTPFVLYDDVEDEREDDEDDEDEDSDEDDDLDDEDDDDSDDDPDDDPDDEDEDELEDDLDEDADEPAGGTPRR